MLWICNSESSYLVFPAIILLCLGGVPIRIANMQFANLFPKNRSTVITFYSGAFSASAVLFVFLKSAYDAGISFAAASSSLVLLSLIMVPVTFVLLPKDKVREPKETKDSESLEQIIKSKKYARSNLSLIGSDITLEGYKDISSPISMKKSFGTLKIDTASVSEKKNHDNMEGGITGPYILGVARGGRCTSCYNHKNPTRVNRTNVYGVSHIHHVHSLQTRILHDSNESNYNENNCNEPVITEACSAESTVSAYSDCCSCCSACSSCSSVPSMIAKAMAIESMVNGASGDDLGSGESKDITENNSDTMNDQRDFSENGLS